MTIIGELGIVYSVTGASVLGIKLLKKKGFYLPGWLLRAGLKCLLIGECLVRSNGYSRCVSTLALHLVVENDFNSAF
ncbi:hypothetical protein ACVWXX_005972 [Bacillus toyonensis]